MASKPGAGWHGLICAFCGERIGVYERIRVELADGTIERSSLLNLDADTRRRVRTVWHLECAQRESAAG